MHYFLSLAKLATISPSPLSLSHPCAGCFFGMCVAQCSLWDNKSRRDWIERQKLVDNFNCICLGGWELQMIDFSAFVQLHFKQSTKRVRERERGEHIVKNTNTRLIRTFLWLFPKCISVCVCVFVGSAEYWTCLRIIHPLSPCTLQFPINQVLCY